MEVSEAISSKLTFLSKFVYPVAVAGLLAAAFISGSPSDRTAVVLVGLPWYAFILYAYGTLKKVSVGASGMRVSNYRKEVVVPYSYIKSISQSRWSVTRPIIVEFNEDTPLGRRIRFMPPPDLRMSFWNEHQIVDQIRKTIEVQGSVLGNPE